MTGKLHCQQALSFRWDVKPRSWLYVVIKNPMALFTRRVGVWPRCPGQIPSTGPCQLWPPNNPHPLDWLYDSLSSPPVAGVWRAHWHRFPVAAIASSKWMLHTVVFEERPPHMIVKCFGCTTIHNKALYKCIIHSYFLWKLWYNWIENSKEQNLFENYKLYVNYSINCFHTININPNFEW